MMINSLDWSDTYDEPEDDIEAMVAAAGNYVRASQDLRPRVLESARTQCGEQRAQRWFGQAAIFVLVVALCTTTHSRRPEIVDGVPSGTLIGTDSERVFTLAEAKVTGSGVDVGWGMVEVFTELRQQQAEILRTGL